MESTESNGRTEYKVNMPFGMSGAKTQYAAGEEVTLYYGLIATDTDYSFGIEPADVEMTRSYDPAYGFVFKFTMPAHDVTLSKTSRNTMVNQMNWQKR